MPSGFRIAAQLYVYGEALQQTRELPAIFVGLAAAGYEAVEGFGGMPEDLSLLTAAGLGYVGPYLVLAGLLDADAVAAQTKRLGGEAVICSGLRDWNVRTPAAYREAVTLLNDAGRRLRSVGLRLCYHNHDFEFEKVEEAQTGMDILCAGLDPEAVLLCVDTGWVWRAGQNPVQFLEDHAHQIGLVHLRDFAGTQSVPLGLGEVPLGLIVAMLPQLPDLRWVVVEQDPNSSAPGTDMSASRAFLRERFSL